MAKTGKKKGPIDLYNIDKKPYKKKDKDAYYYDEASKFRSVPKLTDTKSEILPFLKVCTGQSEQIISDLWDNAFEKNKIILDALEQLRIEASTGEATRWQSISYAKAIKELKTLKVPIVSGEQAQKIKGVGKGIAAVIDEVLKSGKLKPKEEREQSKVDRTKAIDLFMGIWDVNKKLANEWYDKGYRTLEDLSEENLTTEQTLGIKYYSEFILPIDRKYAEEMERWIEDNIGKITAAGKLASRVYLVGEYRRGAQEIKDLSIIISSPNPTKGGLDSVLERMKFVDHVSNLRKRKGNVSGGGEVYMAEVVVRLSSDSHRRLTISMVPSSIIGASLIIFTGPESFVQHLKEQAAQMGYRLSEEGLVKISGEEEELMSLNEVKIFELLGADYVSPEDRF